MTITPSEQETALVLRCDDCGHMWIAASLPMPSRSLAALLNRAECPLCSADPERVTSQELVPTP